MSMSSPQLKRLFFFLLKTQKTIPLKKTKNLQDELNQLEKNKQKVPSFMLTLVVIGGRKMLRIFLKKLERQNMENQTIFELYIDDNTSKYYGNTKGIFKSAKKNYENLYTK